MPEPESSEQLLRKLCELQERQIEKLTDLSTALSELVSVNRTTQENSKTQSEEYVTSQRQYLEHVRQVNRGRIPALILLALIVIAIIASRFL